MRMQNSTISNNLYVYIVYIGGEICQGSMGCYSVTFAFRIAEIGFPSLVKKRHLKVHSGNLNALRAVRHRAAFPTCVAVVCICKYSCSLLCFVVVCVCVHVSICTLAMTFEYPLAERPGQPLARIMTFLLLSNTPLRSGLVSRSLVAGPCFTWFDVERPFMQDNSEVLFMIFAIGHVCRPL